ncbi:sigma-54 dependent transcriptional regulator [Cardiobacteriaceae bacterium TAE3-ERU3]|nr:sigma-54 dependent transcriptional regulator [Cardiobacteriaceae bacterium TAE3-ERU3]
MSESIKALIIDDERDICDLIEMSLLNQRIFCDSAYSVRQALSKLKTCAYSFVICDLKLPDGDGMDVLRHIQKHYPELPVCMITAHGSMETAIEALRLGAFDFINKPLELQPLRNMCTAALKLVNQDADLPPVVGKVRTKQAETSQIQLIGQSAAIENIRKMAEKVSRSQAPVYIYGESGTGKEVVARLIHDLSPRHDGKFIAVNCGALPENLVESEFFGYKKGAFTGADRDQDGLFVAANGGTLFLDEIADLPLAMQVKLLRVIQERAVRPVGASEEQKVDVRIVSASHKDLKQAVADGLFREDLFYRLNVIQLSIPPLRKRSEDIPLLVDYLLDRLCSRHGYEKMTIEDGVYAKLSQHPFKGNVRELENMLERGIAFAENNKIGCEDLFLGIHEPHDQPETHSDEQIVNAQESGEQEVEQSILPADLETHLAQVERKLLLDALKSCDGNKTQAAERLGITFRAMRYKLQKLGID